MKLTAKIIYYENEKNIKEIIVDEVVFCCDDMQIAWKEDFIVFGEYDTFLNKDDNVNISVCQPYPEGAFWDEMPIIFCPFCAEEIKITICQ